MPQVVHGYGLSPVWQRRCFSSTLGFRQSLPQCGQTCFPVDLGLDGVPEAPSRCCCNGVPLDICNVRADRGWLLHILGRNTGTTVASCNAPGWPCGYGCRPWAEPLWTYIVVRGALTCISSSLCADTECWGLAALAKLCLLVAMVTQPLWCWETELSNYLKKETIFIILFYKTCTFQDQRTQSPIWNGMHVMESWIYRLHTLYKRKKHHSIIKVDWVGRQYRM